MVMKMLNIFTAGSVNPLERLTLWSLHYRSVSRSAAIIITVAFTYRIYNHLSRFLGLHCPHGEKVETQILVTGFLSVVGVDHPTLVRRDELAARPLDKKLHKEVGVFHVQNVSREGWVGMVDQNSHRVVEEHRLGSKRTARGNVMGHWPQNFVKYLSLRRHARRMTSSQFLSYL